MAHITNNKFQLVNKIIYNSISYSIYCCTLMYIRISGKFVWFAKFCVKNTSCHKILSKIGIDDISYVLYVIITYKFVFLIIC